MGALDAIDTIRDSGANNGIANSGLVSQSIQRSNIEDLKNLRSAVAESQTSLQNQDESRKSELLSEYLKNRDNILAQTHSSGGNSESSNTLPAYVLSVNPGFNDALNGTPGHGSFFSGNSSMFQIHGADGQYHQFSSVDELNQFLQENPEVASSTVGVAGDSLQKAGFNQNIRLISSQQKNQLLGLTGGSRVTIGPSEQPDTPHSKQIANLTSNRSKFDITQVEPNTQAKIVSDVYSGLQRQASQGMNNNLYTQFKAALSTNNARGFAEALIKDGYTLNGKY